MRENPDTFQCLSTFAAKEVLYTYCTTFGNGYGDHTIIRGTHGTLYSPGGEGSPQWWFVPETRSAWGSNVVFDLKTGKAKPELVTIPGHSEVPPVDQDDDLKYHTDNWFECMRNRRYAQRQYRYGVRARGGGRNGHEELPRRQEDVLGSEE